jgi:hypothetical protein
VYRYTKALTVQWTCARDAAREVRLAELGAGAANVARGAVGGVMNALKEALLGGASSESDLKEASSGGAASEEEGSSDARARATTTAGLPSLPLRTEGRDIVDTTGRRVRLAAVNWAGGENVGYVVSGLDVAPLRSIAR